MFSEGIIVAPATALGGAIATIRLSGEGAIACCDAVFRGRKSLADATTHTLHYGTIVDDNQVVDDVVVSIFRAPHSYTGEESVEISIHGSRYIATKVIELLCPRLCSRSHRPISSRSGCRCYRCTLSSSPQPRLNTDARRVFSDYKQPA